MVEKEDLGLSLSLSFPDNNKNSTTNNPLYHQLNIMPSSLPFNLFHKTFWTDSFPFTGILFLLLLIYTSFLHVFSNLIFSFINLQISLKSHLSLNVFSFLSTLLPKKLKTKMCLILSIRFFNDLY